MTASREPDVLIHAFLEEGQAELPDRAFDAVRRDIHVTRQRVVIGPWREPDMTMFARVAIAAAAVVAVGFAWINFGPSQGNVGGVPTSAPTATPSPSPTAQPSPSLLAAIYSGELKPGRYAFTPEPMSVEVPAGWSVDGGSYVNKNYDPTDAGAGGALAMWEVVGTFVDPCHDHTLVQPLPVGIDDLAEALANQPGISAGPITDVTVDGFEGKFVELTVTVDIETCSRGSGGGDEFWLFAAADGDRRYVQGTNEMNRIYILDVDGERFTFNARFPERMTPADRAELEGIIDSIDITP
jgi:hypothetical protein